MQFFEQKLNGVYGLTLVLSEAIDPVLDMPDQSQLCIRSDCQGVRLSGEGNYFTSMDDLEVFAKAIDKAWKFHRTQAPKILNARGH
jgi:hypothetical protein